MKKGRIFWIVVAVGLLAVIVWRVSVKQAEASQVSKQQAQRKNAPASAVLTQVAARDIDQTLTAVGNLESPFVVKFASQVTGRIVYLEAREGDPVKAGQVLVRLDPSEIRAMVGQQQSAVAEAQSRLAQAQLTKEANDVTVNESVRQQTAGSASAQADYEQQKQNISFLAASDQAAIDDAQAKVNSASANVQSALADLGAAQANESNANAKLARTRSLYQQGFTAAQDVDDARTAADVAHQVTLGAKQRVSAQQALVASAQQQLATAKNLASINARKNSAALQSAKAKYDQAISSLAIAGANRSQMKAYEANLAALRAAVGAAQAQLAQAQSQLGFTTISSTIDGTVTTRSADAGALATPGLPLLTVQFLDWLYVNSAIPVERAAQIKPGTKARVVFDSAPDRPYEATVDYVNGAADPASRQVTVRLRVTNADHALRPGLFGHVSFVLGTTHAAAAVPLEAVHIENGSQPYVYSVDKDFVAHKTTVSLGAQDDRGYEIVSGLAPGDQVVTLTYQAIRDGQKIKPPQSGKGGGKTGSEKGGKSGS